MISVEYIVVQKCGLDIGKPREGMSQHSGDMDMIKINKIDMIKINKTVCIETEINLELLSERGSEVLSLIHIQMCIRDRYNSF